MTPMKTREAAEIASAAMKAGKCPPRSVALRVAQALDSLALAIALGTEPTIAQLHDHEAQA